MKSLHLDGRGALFVLIWSSGYVVGALATQVMAPLAVTFWRFVVAAAILGGVAVARREHWPRSWALARVAAAGVPMFAVQFGALYTALSDGTPPSTTSLIACSAPLLVAVIGAALRWEQLSLLNWAGVGLGVVGVVVTLADHVGRPASAAGFAWTLLGLAGLVVGTLLQARLRTAAGPFSIAAVQITVGAAVLAVWAPLRGSMTIPLTAHALLSFAWLAVVAGAGAPILMFAMIRARGATAASSLLFVVPAITAFAAWPVLGNPVGWLAVFGLAIAATGLVLARRPARSTRPAAQRRAPRVERRSARPRSIAIEGRDGRDLAA